MPPQNDQAEETCLGLFMLDPKTLDAADQLGLRADDFQSHGNRVTYEVIRHLHERGELSELTVVSELKARRKLTAAGGTSHVISLAERAMGHVATAKRHIDDVIDAAKLRSMWDAGKEILRMSVEHPDKISKLVDRTVSLAEGVARNAQRTNGVIGDSDSLAEWSVKHVLGQTDQKQKWAYPLEQLQMATGGFGRGQLIAVGAQPGVGKSAFKNQILLGVPADIRVGIINLEMDQEDEQVRLLSSLTGIDGRLIWQRKLNDEQQVKVVEAAEILGSRQYDIHQGSKTIEGIRAIQKRHGYPILLVDHVHRIDGVEDYQQYVRICRMLKSLALDEDCAVIALFQMNLPPNKDNPGEIPTTTRIKNGPALWEESDHMFFLHRNYNDQKYPTKNGQIICAKQRGGDSGWAIPLVFNAHRCAFEEV